MATTKKVARAASRAASPVSPAAPDRLARLKELVAVLEGSSLSELSYEDEDLSVTLVRGGRAAPVTGFAPAPAPAAPATPAAAPQPAADPDVVTIKSPFVGTFYRSPKPGLPAFTEVGARVRRGQTLCIVEAMKLMNEIEAEVDGTVVEVLAENNHAVQYGDALFRIRKG